MGRLLLCVLSLSLVSVPAYTQTVSLDTYLGAIPKPYTLLDVQIDDDNFTEQLAVHVDPYDPREIQTFYVIDVCEDGQLGVSNGFKLPALPTPATGFIRSHASLGTQNGVGVFKIFDIHFAFDGGDPHGIYTLRYVPIPQPCQ
jgi:hypothetical protein